MSLLDMNLGCHACTTNTLRTESSLHLTPPFYILSNMPELLQISEKKDTFSLLSTLVQGNLVNAEEWRKRLRDQLPVSHKDLCGGGGWVGEKPFKHFPESVSHKVNTSLKSRLRGKARAFDGSLCAD